MEVSLHNIVAALLEVLSTTRCLILHPFLSLYCYIFHQYSSRASCGSCVCCWETLDTTTMSCCQASRRSCRWWHADRDRLIAWKNCWKMLKTRQAGSLSLHTGCATIIRRLATEHKQLNMSETHSMSRRGLPWRCGLTGRFPTWMLNIAEHNCSLNSERLHLRANFWKH